MKFIAFLYYKLLTLRYSIDVTGLENLDPSKRYILFPNHQALVDPQIVVSILMQKIPVSPVISETYFHIPVASFFFKQMGAVPMGDIQRGTSTGEEVKKAFVQIETALKSGSNILLYPAGQLYSQNYEVIKGKKAAYELVKNMPENTEILVIRTTGLWGSIWSKAWEGNTPDIIKTFLFSLFTLGANALFFTPKRPVRVCIENHTEELKKQANLQSFNEYLENYYNIEGKEDLNYKKHFFYLNDTANRNPPKTISGSVEANGNMIDAKNIPESVQKTIITKIAEMKERDTTTISLESNLILDIFLDSLDAAELKAFVQAQFKGASNPPITDLKTVGDLCMMAIGKSGSNEELKPCDWKLPEDSETTLHEIIKNHSEKYGDSASILTHFKEAFCQNSNEGFVYDILFGMQTKRAFLVKTFLLSSYISKMEGKYIGIMLPSVSSASFIIIATLLAGKVPVMLNWTVGEASLLHCAKYSKLTTILTAKAFYDKVKNDGTEKLRDSYVFLEEMLKNVPLSQKIMAVVRSLTFPIPQVSMDDEAVLLFTSGSESLPKAVSLTHRNILKDIEGALAYFPIAKKDILIGFLPPFHSFGFTVNTIMPLITGLRVAYTPDPSDSKTISKLIEHTQATALTATPTFLRMILNASEVSTCSEDSLDGAIRTRGTPGEEAEALSGMGALCSKPGDSGKMMKFAGKTSTGAIRTLGTMSEETEALNEKFAFCRSLPCRSLASLTYAVVGAEKCPESLMEKFSQYCPDGKILEGYGITECSPVISINPPSKAKFGSVGIPIAGSEVQILSLENQEKLPAMKEGMIYFSGDNVFSGYLDTSIESPFDTIGGKKFYKTGDLGYLDTDGYLFITGRLKRFVKIAGEMVSLPFVEGILNKKFGSETELTLAVEAKEEKGEVKIVAFSIKPLELEDIGKTLREGGASNLVKISEVILVPAIPVLGTGKTDYKVLKGMIEMGK